MSYSSAASDGTSAGGRVNTSDKEHHITNLKGEKREIEPHTSGRKNRG